MAVDRTFFCFFRTFALLKVLWAAAVLMAADVTLTSVQSVRTLTPEQASHQIPVKLKGVVTYYDGIEGHAFLQDNSGGIFFYPGRSRQNDIPILKAGEEIEIEGVAKQGRFSPSVAGYALPPAIGSVSLTNPPVKITHFGTANLPTPSEVTLDQVMTGAYHDQFVRMRGVIRSIEIEPRGPERRTSALTLKASFARGTISMRIPNFDPQHENEVRSWKDTESEFDGVIAGGGNALGQLSDVRLLVPSIASIKPDMLGTRAGFDRVPLAFHEVLRFDSSGATRRRVLVHGIVTVAQPGAGIYLSDKNDFFWVATSQENKFVPGDSVDVFAFPAQKDKFVYLEDGIIRIVSHGAPITPRGLSSDQCASDRGSGQYVSIEGQLEADWHVEGYRLLFLYSAGRHFTTRILETKGDKVPQLLATGSILNVRGVLETVASESSANPPADFHILAQSPADITILRAPSWWNPSRLIFALAITVLFLGGVLLWALFLRQQVERRRAQLIAEIKTRLATESVETERRRLATDLHDTLEQTLTGTAFQLEAAEVMHGHEAAVKAHLSLAHKLLARSREELRQTIWDLTPGAIQKFGLHVALEKLAHEMNARPECKVEVYLNGNDTRLPDRIATHLFRVAQEALSNALKYSRAKNIHLELAVTSDAVNLSIQDDGIGFIAERVPGPDQGHFGLRGMHERIKRLGGTLSIQSDSRGTTITARLNAKSFEAY